MKKLALCLLLLAGCGPRWVVAGHYAPPDGKYDVQLPAGWVRPEPNPVLVTTRDGYPLQAVSVHFLAFDQTLGASKKTVRKGMLPQEVAEVMRDSFEATLEGSGVELLENAPATVSGRDGLRLLFRFKNTDGLRFKVLLYGVLGDTGLYTLYYAAPERYYFDRDLAAFEAVKSSFRLH